MTLAILKHQSLEDELSPEFRYLLSLLRARAQEVFGAVTLSPWRPGAPEPPPPDRDYVLLLGRDNVWMTAATLQEMKNAIDTGADLAVPDRLTDFPQAGLEPIYTARDFEQTEQRLRKEARVPALRAPSQLPIALFSGVAFRALATAQGVSRLLVDPDALGRAPRFRRAEGTGLYLLFPDYYGETRADLLPYLPGVAEDVLEIGCGRGRTGKLIQDALGCRVTGVERHPGIAAEAARRLWRVIVGDVLTVPLDGTFDAIVASEIVEHLHDPDAFFARLRPLLKPRARIVLSIPNVGHYSIVEDLLAGRWDYVPAGLLCATHLRFFTRQTLTEWMSRLGFTCTVVPQTTELPERFHQLPAVFESDLHSLRTKGFYVIVSE